MLQHKNLFGEIQDEMFKRGVSKWVLFTPADSIWTMIMHLNNVKEAVRVHANSMFRDTMKHAEIKIKTTLEKKIIIESDSSIDEVWITKSYCLLKGLGTR